MKLPKNFWLTASLLSVGGYALLRRPAGTAAIGTAGLAGGLFVNTNLGDILASARRIVRDLGPSVDQAVRLSGVPRWLVLSIAAYEVRDRPYNVVNPAVGATGVMQITPITGVDALYFADKYGLLTPEAVSILQRGVGQAAWPLLMKSARNRSAEGAKYLKAALKNPEFNLLLGSFILRAGLMQHKNSDGQPNLAKVVLQYNQGFSFGLKKLDQPGMLNASSAMVYARAPRGEGKLYVSNMLAPGGVIDLMRSQSV